MNGWVQALVGLGGLVGLISPVLFRVQRRAIAGGARLSEAQADGTVADAALRQANTAMERAERAEAKADRCEAEVDQLREYIGQLRGDYRRETGKEPRVMPAPLPWPRISKA